LTFVGYAGLILKLGHQKWFAQAGRLLTPLDRSLQRRTGNRWSIIGKNVAPGLLLSTTGRRSGLARDTPLLFASDDNAFVVVGSNYGRTNHPDWSANLLAHPDASVTIEGRRVEVVAELADRAQKERVWPLILRVWPAYDTYAARSGRDLRVFILRPNRQRVQER
jgi:deazaflavin-dependent oxidoreductase (nitroreductase family)